MFLDCSTTSLANSMKQMRCTKLTRHLPGRLTYWKLVSITFKTCWADIFIFSRWRKVGEIISRFLSGQLISVSRAASFHFCVIVCFTWLVDWTHRFYFLIIIWSEWFWFLWWMAWRIMPWCKPVAQRRGESRIIIWQWSWRWTICIEWTFRWIKRGGFYSLRNRVDRSNSE